MSATQRIRRRLARAAGPAAGRGRRDARPTGQPAPRRRARVAILVVNGFRRGEHADYYAEEASNYPWLKVCLRQIERHTRFPHVVHVWDNSFLPDHQDLVRDNPRARLHHRRDGNPMNHGQALDRLLGLIPDHIEYVVTLDTDAFPIRSGWLQNLIGRLDAGAMLTGVWRDEMAPKIEPFVHPSCLAARLDTLRGLGTTFARGQNQDVAQGFTRAVMAQGGAISRLRRSNQRNLHYLMGGVYGDLIYHQGAGSRDALFWTSTDKSGDEVIREALRNAAFTNLDGLMDYLSGNSPDEAGAALGLPEPKGA